ncbi:hypothetical protein [Arenibacter echinorum]|uniref:Uncharacterized protein n=1 Tax=Arenibacter echinorum TaxID=440515 RepID=A0A327R4V0_9FLAO|nr:hypothetical protein [Arenibacter echinorum]RAJ11711.1 hypothetical protein LV92_02643 [Arenibacter echinorum]
MKWLKKILGLDKQCEQLLNIQQLLNSIQLEQKPFSISSNFKLVDPLNKNVELFAFKEIEKDLSISKNNILIKNGDSIIRNFFGSVPEFISTGLISKSYKFVFPQGFSGQIMQIGNGQGTAIMQNGSILAHGSYVKNIVVAAPFAVYSLGNMVIRQHYLNKIHESLERISEKLNDLIELEFIKKEAKIDAIIYFYKKAYFEFDNINTNENYKNAILTNIVAKNIEVFELIKFYEKSIHKTGKYDATSINNFEDQLKIFVQLQDLFLYGKLLAFVYANLYNKELQMDFIKEFENVRSIYLKTFKANSIQINKILDENKIGWSDWLKRSRAQKLKARNSIINDLLTIDSITRVVEENFEEGKVILIDFITKIELPQEFIFEEGELYQITY